VGKSVRSVSQQNERYSIQNGIATMIVLSSSNAYFALFAISVLGVSNYQIGLMNSLPQFIGMFAMVIGSFILNRLTVKKKFTLYSFLFTRIFLLGMMVVVYLPKGMAGWVFVFLVGLMNLPGSFANLSWQSFIADLISEKRRSHFFSERNKILTIVGMVVTSIIGLILHFFNKSNPFPYQAIFLFAFLCGIVELYFLQKHLELKKTPKKVDKKVQFGFRAFRHKPFLYFLVCALFFNFAWQMAWSLFSIYQIKNAMASGFWISAMTVTSQIGQIVSFKWWGRMAEKYSNAKMLILISLGMALAPTLTILSTNLVYLSIVFGFSGLFLSGTVLLLFNQLLEVTNKENRDSSIAIYNIMLAIIGFIAPQFGVYLLDSVSMNFAMILSTVLRLGSGGLFFMLFQYLHKQKVGFKKLVG
jgi:MFS family permease